MLLVHLDGPGELLPSLGVRLLSVNFSHFKLLLRNHCQLEPKLAGTFLGWSSTKFLFFVPVGYSTWLPVPIICSDRLKFQRSSLKLMNSNCKLECPLPSFCFLCRSKIQDGCHRRTQINIELYGKMFKCLLLRNYKSD